MEKKSHVLKCCLLLISTAHWSSAWPAPLTSWNLEQDYQSDPDSVPGSVRADSGTRSYFDIEASSDTAVLVGQTAFLTCRVQVAGNWTVSWVRHRDIHLLTVGTDTYTADRRFRGLHVPDSAEWTLQIKAATMDDAGDYECQLSSTPLRTHVVRLHVFEPYIRVINGADVYLHEESSLNLTCVVNPAIDASLLLWSRNGQIINWLYQGETSETHISVFDGRRWTDRGGDSEDRRKKTRNPSKKSRKEDFWLSSTVSQLVVQKAQLHHSGRYSCSILGYSGTPVSVHVLAEEQPAAMQRGTAQSTAAPWIIWILITVLLL